MLIAQGSKPGCLESKVEVLATLLPRRMAKRVRVMVRVGALGKSQLGLGLMGGPTLSAIPLSSHMSSMMSEMRCTAPAHTQMSPPHIVIETVCRLSIPSASLVKSQTRTVWPSTCRSVAGVVLATACWAACANSSKLVTCNRCSYIRRMFEMF